MLLFLLLVFLLMLLLDLSHDGYRELWDPLYHSANCLLFFTDIFLILLLHVMFESLDLFHHFPPGMRRLYFDGLRRPLEGRPFIGGVGIDW